MKHIKEILEQRKLSLFGRDAQKGSAEWSAFNSIREDKADAYRVSAPRAPEVRYSNVVKIRRFRAPHSLFPRHAN